MTEADFIAALRALPLHPGARELRDDVATLGTLVLTTDTLVEGVHYRAGEAPQDVAWRLVATNLSDLAAKGAKPVGVLLNYPLRCSPAKAGAQIRSGDDDVSSISEPTSATGPRPLPGINQTGERDWDAAFLEGFGEALACYAAPMLGGDTVSLPADAPRVITLTAIGESAAAPDRRGAKAGDALYVTGVIGAALLGFEHAEIEPNAYRRPVARIADGIALAPQVRAMMDVSDGLLLDASRMAAASGLAVEIVLAAVPVPPELAHDKIRAATWGDDYQLLFALPPERIPPVPATRIGTFALGTGLTVIDKGKPIALPLNLGYQHGV